MSRVQSSVGLDKNAYKYLSGQSEGKKLRDRIQRWTDFFFNLVQWLSPREWHYSMELDGVRYYSPIYTEISHVFWFLQILKYVHEFHNFFIHVTHCHLHLSLKYLGKCTNYKAYLLCKFIFPINSSLLGPGILNTCSQTSSFQYWFNRKLSLKHIRSLKLRGKKLGYFYDTLNLKNQIDDNLFYMLSLCKHNTRVIIYFLLLKNLPDWGLRLWLNK
jgi:hypothetical protein